MRDDLSTLDGFSEVGHFDPHLPELYHSNAGTDIDLEFQLQQSLLGYLDEESMDLEEPSLFRKSSEEEGRTLLLIKKIRSSEAEDSLLRPYRPIDLISRSSRTKRMPTQSLN